MAARARLSAARGDAANVLRVVLFFAAIAVAAIVLLQMHAGRSSLVCSWRMSPRLCSRWLRSSAWSRAGNCRRKKRSSASNI